MGLATAALRLAIDAALGAWLGIAAFFSFVGAPRAFAVFEDRAGEYVNDVFPRYYLLGVVLGSVALLAGILLGIRLGFDSARTTLVVLTALVLGVAAYSRWWLIPKMDAAGEDAFDTYHRVSVVLNGAMLLATGMALVAAHLP